LKVDALVTVGVTLGKDKKPWLTISVFRTSRRQIEDEISLPIEALPHKLDAFMSRWLACLPVLERSGSRSSGRRKKASVWLDTSASYAQYQRHSQIRRAFHSLGFAVGVAQRVGPGFEWYGRLNLYTSLSDSYRDLLHPFNSVRVLAGVGFATGKSPVRVFARTGLDFHILGNFLATRDPWCKAGGESHPLCSGSVTSLEQDILVGVNLAVGSQLHIGRRFFVVLQSSVSTYFLPFDGTNELNYPLSAELGMGYQF
jgi:hypothetical protein